MPKRDDIITREMAKAGYVALCLENGCRLPEGHGGECDKTPLLMTPIARAKTISQVIYEDHIAASGDDADQPWLLRLLERTEYEARQAYGDDKSVVVRALAQACTNLAMTSFRGKDTSLGEEAQRWQDALLAGWAGVEGWPE